MDIEYDKVLNEDDEDNAILCEVCGLEMVNVNFWICNECFKEIS